MKYCPKCNSEHKKLGKFCSRKCANSRVFSAEARYKKSIALKGKPSKLLSPAKFADKLEKYKKTIAKNLLEAPFESLGPERKRRRVFAEQKYSCNRCKLSTWLEYPITLELEHIDGNNQNNARENLEGLCPNCHSFTDTWRGRNKHSKNGSVKITDNYLLQCLNESNTIRQGLLKAGIAAKGNNYNRANLLLRNQLGNKKE